MLKIAVTGATGFIGGHLLAALDGAYDVQALTRSSRTDFGSIQWVSGSLEDQASLDRLVRGADIVIHLAASVKALSRKAFFAANHEGTARLLDAMRRCASDARLIHISSLAARFPHLSHYAASKHAAELCVQEVWKDRPWVILRPPGLYGPGDHEILKLIKTAAYGVLPVPGNRRNRVSLLFGPDLADLIKTLSAQLYGSGQIIEVDDGKKGGYSYTELAALLTTGLGRRVRPITVPAPILYTIGGLSQCVAGLARKPVMLSAAKARELCHSDWSVRSSADVADIPWSAQKDFASGLQATLAWARAGGLI